MSLKKVLIVDDEPYIREVAQISLETIMTNWKIITADSGSAALVLANQEKPDAILLDVMMPGMDGIRTYQKLKADVNTQLIPVIFLTAKVQADDCDRYAKYGVAGTISKPFNPLTLALQMSQLLGW